MMSTNSTLFLVFSLLASAAAWTSHNQPTHVRSSSTAAASREDFLKSMAAIAVASATTALLPTASALADETLPSGVTYTVKKKGDGPKPESGELVAIRFAAYSGEIKIDDIFATPEPYYTRVGSGGLLKGVETTLPLMRVGDRWVLNIPVRSLWALVSMDGSCSSMALFVGCTSFCLVSDNPLLIPIHCLFVRFLRMVTNYSQVWRLDPKDVRRQPESQEFHPTPPSFLMWKSLVCQERNPS